MLTLKDLRNRSNILGEQIPGTHYFALTLVDVNGEHTPLGAMTVTPRQMFALYRDPSEHAAILATSERMPADG